MPVGLAELSVLSAAIGFSQPSSGLFLAPAVLPAGLLHSLSVWGLGGISVSHRWCSRKSRQDAWQQLLLEVLAARLGGHLPQGSPEGREEAASSKRLQ